MQATNRLLFTLTIAVAVATGQSRTDEGIESFRQGLYSQAIDKLNDAKDERGQAFYGLALAATNKCSSALPHLREASHDASVARLQSIAAVKCYMATDRLPDAGTVLAVLSKQMPDDPDVLYLQAKLHMKGFNDATLAMFQKAPASYRVHQLSAEVLETQSRYNDAIPEYRKAIELNPKATDLHFRLGRALLFESHEEKALTEAASEFEAELKLTPEDAACEFQLGQIALVRGDSAEAKKRLQRSLALSPDFVSAMIALGKIASRDKKPTEAITLLTRAVQTQPENQSAHYALMTAYRDAGNIEQAKAEKATLDKLQKPSSGEFADFLKKIGEKPHQQ